MATGTSATTTALAEPVRWRRSAENLTGDQLERLREAFRRLMKIKDDRGYWGHAGIHGLPLPDHCRVAHGTDLFLPWHRAYLYRFERALQDRGDPGVTVPWWDWTSAASQAEGGQLPRAFTAKRPGNRANPLFSAEVDPVALDEWRRQRPSPRFMYASRTERYLGQASQLPTAQRVKGILAIDDFQAFSGALEEIHGWVHDRRVPSPALCRDAQGPRHSAARHDEAPGRLELVAADEARLAARGRHEPEVQPAAA